jgi:hypothetical protein
VKKIVITLCFVALAYFIPTAAFADYDMDNSPDSGTPPQTQLVSDTELQKLGCTSPNQYGGIDPNNVLHQGCSAAAELDLTGLVPAKASFVVVTQGPAQADDTPGVLSVCFLLNDQANCDRLGSMDNYLCQAAIIQSKDSRFPLVVVRSAWDMGRFNGDTDEMIWAYDPAAHAFKQIWNGGSDGLEDMRFVTEGPMSGDLIVTVDNPTHHFPWPWGIDVYKLARSDHYVKVLSFIGKAVQAGNTPAPDAVIDIDMPQTLHRLHLQN